MNGLAIVLHAHLPYVHHSEPNRLEERWLFEAMTETYLPLLWQLEKLPEKKMMTLSLSPPLMEMLADPLLQERYKKYLRVTQKLLQKEKRHGFIDTELLRFYELRYNRLEESFHKYNQNLLTAFAECQDKLALITTSATHAILPYMCTMEGIRTQVENGLKCFEKHFGFQPTGFWTPECAIDQRVDEALAVSGIEYTFVDEHALPTRQPYVSPNGVMLFPRNKELSGAVWSSVDGYPGNPTYREFYRDVAYERPDHYIAPFIHPDGIRIDTGLKCWRVTGKETKEPYMREAAELQAQADAIDFWNKVRLSLDQEVIKTIPFDAELFGHWWFEGPEWLRAMLQEGSQSGQLIVPETIKKHPMPMANLLLFSTWGRDGYGDVWMNENNRFMYKQLHEMEMELVYRSKRTSEFSLYESEMVKEWLLAASSDWAFIVDGQTATSYAKERFSEHVDRFQNWMKEREAPLIPTPIFTDMKLDMTRINVGTKWRPGKLSVLILALEYPPHIVGGIAKHVQQIAQALTRLGYNVHVFTAASGKEDQVIDAGVHVHYVSPLQPKGPTFKDWVTSFNFACIDAVERLCIQEEIMCIHAHDWTTAIAGAVLKERLSIPLIGVVHGTLDGRAKHAPLLKASWREEEILFKEADHLFVCSQFVFNELKSHGITDEKMSVFYSGTQNIMIKRKPDEQRFIIYASGRLVPEKGFDLLIKAMALLPENSECIIAGTGPDLIKLRALSEKLAVSVTFLGFIDDHLRNRWFEKADVVVVPSTYEPFGLAALEAMSGGLPVIAAKTGGLCEIVLDGKTGYLFEPGSVQDLAEALRIVYEEGGMAAVIGENAKAYVLANLSWQEAAKKMEECMQRVMPNRVHSAIRSSSNLSSSKKLESKTISKKD